MTRRYGQHFLKDPRVIGRLVDGSGVGPDDAVLEIGPGLGALTRVLASRARRVLAVEIDRRLHRRLSEAGLPPNVELRLADVLRLENAEISAALGGAYHLVSNLPYEIGASVLEKFLTRGPKPESLTLMLQQEVGERVAASSGSASRLGLFCGYYAEARKLFDVPPGAFDPPPRVRSCVVRLVPRKVLPLPAAAEAGLFRLIAAAFAEKRRRLANSLRRALGPEAEKRLRQAGFDPDGRPEQTSLTQWISLAQRL